MTKSEALSYAREHHPLAEVFDAYEATDAQGQDAWDVLVWAREEDAGEPGIGDDGSRAIARYTLPRASEHVS